MAETPDELEPPPVQDQVVTLKEFAALDWQAPLEGSRKVDAGDLADLYSAAAKTAEADGDAAAARVFGLLFHLCNIALNPSDPATPFQPRVVFTDGRSADASDYRGAQSEAFVALMTGVANPGLKARLADVAWTNDRRQAGAARLAVEAYCETIEGLLEGRFDEAVPGFGTSTFEQVALAKRALQIGRNTLKGNALPDRATAVAKAIYERARDSREHAVFIDAAKLMAEYGLVDEADIGRDAEAVASAPFDPRRAMVIQGVWELAASAFAQARDEEGERRCRLRSVDMTLARARAATSAIVAAHFLGQAIEMLRRTRDTKALRNELYLELRGRQRDARDEFKPMRFTVDIQETVKATLKALEGRDLPGLLKVLVTINNLADPDAERKAAIETLSGSVTAGIFGGAHSDADGKLIAQTPSFGLGDTPNEARIDEQISQTLGLRRNYVAGAIIRPARDAMMDRFAFAERHFWPIVELSPFVPPGQAAVFVLGFTRFLQGDMMSAAHLLLPQVEAMLRHALLQAGHEPTVARSDMLQEDQSLDPLLTGWRSQLDGLFGRDLIFEVDFLFNKRPGPRLRHDFAHGKVTAAQCYSPDVIYACWLIYSGVAYPLLDHWQAEVAPLILAREADPSQELRKD